MSLFDLAEQYPRWLFALEPHYAFTIWERETMCCLGRFTLELVEDQHQAGTLENLLQHRLLTVERALAGPPGGWSGHIWKLFSNEEHEHTSAQWQEMIERVRQRAQTDSREADAD